MCRELAEAQRILASEGVGPMLNRLGRYLARLLVHYPIARLRMPGLASRLELAEAIEYVFSGAGRLFLPAQVRSEVEAFFRFLELRPPRTIVEIGTAAGGMLFLFTRIAHPEATIITIDLRGGPYGGGYPNWRSPLYRRFAKPGQKLHLVRASSHDPATVAQVQRLLAGQPIDLLFIDGDHSYRGVTTDFALYGPLVDREGLIAMHDIVPAPPQSGLEVSRFWDELATKHSRRAFIADRRQGGFGIGVVRPTAHQSARPGFTPPGAPLPD